MIYALDLATSIRLGVRRRPQRNRSRAWVAPAYRVRVKTFPDDPRMAQDAYSGESDKRVGGCISLRLAKRVR